MRVLSWNMRRASEASTRWSRVLHHEPDVALLQEVVAVPADIRSRYRVRFAQARGKTKEQPFGSAVLFKDSEATDADIHSGIGWVDSAIGAHGGYAVAMSGTTCGVAVTAISVHSPAWALSPAHWAAHDVTTVKLTETRDIWLADLIYAAVSTCGDRELIVGGDFNLCETLDRERPKGNAEYLERMRRAGFIECLRSSQGKLTPTYKHRSAAAAQQQLDHVFVTRGLATRLTSCDVGAAGVFENNLSDHLTVIADFA